MGCEQWRQQLLEDVRRLGISKQQRVEQCDKKCQEWRTPPSRTTEDVDYENQVFEESVKDKTVA